MLQKWKLTKINFTKPHENITYKGSNNKANAQHIVQELCESRGGRPGLSVLTSLMFSVDVKNY